MNKITRSTVNEQQYSAPKHPTSGFPLSYRRYSNHALGRIHIAGFHWVMAGDKISGRTSGDSTFERIVTPIMSPVNAMQYNMYIPLRPLDRTFKKGITPTKLNNMSYDWTMPLFNTRYLFRQLLLAFWHFDASTTDAQINNSSTNRQFGVLHSLLQYVRESGNENKTMQQWMDDEDFNTNYIYDTGTGLVGDIVYQLTTSGTRLTLMADNMYLRDALLDVAELIKAKLGDAENPISMDIKIVDWLNLFLSTIFEPWIGRYSYYAELKYEFLRPFDFYRISHGLADYSSYVNPADIFKLISDTPQNEYAIRGMYAIWYERFRNVDLEPVSNDLPDWQEFGSTSIFDMSAGGNLCYLLYRIRPWEQDVFINAQIDDISRHVFAPILNNTDSTARFRTAKVNSLDANPEDDLISFSKPSVYELVYRDQLNDSNEIVSCPVPSNVNDVISSLDSNFENVYGLDLNTLRQSQMLERYLKRNYLFGDEYQDRMLAHYNSRVSDMRVNKPEILSMSMNGYEMGQQVSNVSTDQSKVGDRTATATLKVNGEPFTDYCEEFGIVYSLVVYMPRSMYDGSCPQNYMSKCVDLPLPEFAANNEEFGRKLEIAGSGLATGYDGNEQNTKFIFGRYPAYHAWRARTDEVGGKFLDEMQNCTFRRFFGMFSDDTTPKLNYFFIHCRPNLDMFADNILYDMQVYSDLVHEFFVERVLPTPVEVI